MRVSEQEATAGRIRPAREQERSKSVLHLCTQARCLHLSVADKKKGYVAGASLTRLLEFNPTSRQHIAWALQNFSSARFTKVTNTGKPKVDEATLSEMRDLALSHGQQQAA